MKIKTWRDPYDAGFSPTRPKEIEIEEGLTVLVGCNGAGKSTLLLNIKEEMKKNKIPCYYYNNLREGNDSIGKAIFNGNIGMGALLMSSSEGECIKLNLSNFSNLLDNFIENGYLDTKQYRFERAFKRLSKDVEEEIVEESNKRVLLFDAVDSGLSVDSIIELSHMFEELLQVALDVNKELYIVIAANEYELARNRKCFDVNKGIYIEFKDYEDYRKYIIKSRQSKEKRIEKQQIWFHKKHDKEKVAFEKYLERVNPKKEKLKKQLENEPNNHRLKWQLEELERDIRKVKPKWWDDEMKEKKKEKGN